MEAETSSDQRPVIQAREILDKIERGEDVEYDGVIVEGDLDISGLELPTEHVVRKEHKIKILGLAEEVKLVKLIASSICITNSEILGNVSFGNVIFIRTYAVGVIVILLLRCFIYSFIELRMTPCLLSNQLRDVLILSTSNLRNALIENSICVL